MSFSCFYFPIRNPSLLLLKGHHLGLLFNNVHGEEPLPQLSVIGMVRESITLFVDRRGGFLHGIDYTTYILLRVHGHYCFD